jgi:hypothetical protein
MELRMDMDLFAALLWAAAAGGVVALALAAAMPGRRRTWLLTAGVLFLPIGVLGILSVGIFFLVAAVLCLVAAQGNHRAGRTGQDPSVRERAGPEAPSGRPENG